MERSRHLGFWIGILITWVCVGGAFGEEPEPPKTGLFTAQFSDRSPDSSPERLAAVARWPREKIRDYDIADHSFQLVVPNDYDGTDAYGLLVFIHPNNEVSLDHLYGRAIKDLLAKHKLIWVSFSDAGNPVMPNVRLGLALDAVHNVSRRYKIDDRRVYVSGLSGGGRMTCMAGVYFPQVFKGAVPIVGTLYFRQATVPKDPALRALMRPKPANDNAVWPQGLLEPSKRKLQKMAKEQRWVLLAGDKDFNMPQMRAHYEQGFAKDKFQHAHYLEVPGMGHTYPKPEWFEKAIVLLDKPLTADKNLPPADERTQRLAQRRLEVALRALERDRERGVRALQRLIEELPNTDAAGTARDKLSSLQD